MLKMDAFDRTDQLHYDSSSSVKNILEVDRDLFTGSGRNV